MHTQRNTYQFLSVFVALLACVCQALGQDAENTLFRHLQSQESPHLIISTDFESLFEKENEELDATLAVKGDDRVWDIKIEARGKYRRRVCPFPPLRLNFKKGDLKEAGFKPYDKIKLVTHCSEEDISLETIYEEYLAYQIYNCITDESFQADLVQMTYQDTEGEFDPIESWGIILEPNDELADRLGGKLYDKYNLPEDSLVAENYLHTALFQFMIGNHDWSLEMYKNIKCLYLPEKGRYLIIPYDFDYTGFVHPDYYQPEVMHGIQNTRDRLYLGKYFNDELPQVIQDFWEDRNEIRNICKSLKELPGGARSRALTYINNFFRAIQKDADKIEFGYRLPYFSN